MNWPFRKSETTCEVQKRQIKVVRTTELRLKDWIADPTLVAQAGKLMNLNVAQAMLAVLRNESPANYELPIGATHDDRIAHACRIEGYNLAVNNLEAMNKSGTHHDFIESTFEPEHSAVLERDGRRSA